MTDATQVTQVTRYAWPTDRPLPQVPQRLKDSAEDFEAMVVSQMLVPMFEGIKTDGPFGGGAGEAAFRTFLIDEYGKAIAARGGIGLSDMMIRSLLVTEEAPHGQ
ncbi:rod-binding protein [Zavarzinia compransoris]|uniref:rod-binding protein n=1 Tax=Zavarzinia marina TaxID=2911065 RepID=UPI001F4627CB|nr:rod-binding protein [Zavarzinia marina]MCF4166590.1 rod-binding protein [Zavarzinia marina]